MCNFFDCGMVLTSPFGFRWGDECKLFCIPEVTMPGCFRAAGLFESQVPCRFFFMMSNLKLQNRITWDSACSARVQQSLSWIPKICRTTRKVGCIKTLLQCSPPVKKKICCLCVSLCRFVHVFVDKKHAKIFWKTILK